MPVYTKYRYQRSDDNGSSYYDIALKPVSGGTPYEFYDENLIGQNGRTMYYRIRGETDSVNGDWEYGTLQYLVQTPPFTGYTTSTNDFNVYVDYGYNEDYDCLSGNTNLYKKNSFYCNYNLSSTDTYDGLHRDTGYEPGQTYLVAMRVNDNWLGLLGLNAQLSVSIPSLTPPDNLAYSGVTFDQATLSWDINTVNGNSLILQRKNGSSWLDFKTLGVNDTGTVLTNLDAFTDYTLRLKQGGVVKGKTSCNQYNKQIYIYSSEISFKTTPLLVPLCNEPWQDRFSIDTATCGLPEGNIILNVPSYLYLYDISIFDYEGGQYFFDDDEESPTYGESEGLPAGYYRTIAVPKPEFYNDLGNQTCYFDFIEVPSVSTTLSLTNVSIKNVICGGFGKQQGRLVYFFDDSLNNTYTFKLFKSTENNALLLSNQTGLSKSAIQQLVFTNLDEGDYYGYLENESTGCALLTGLNSIISLDLVSVPGIKKLYLTEWANTVEYNYWSLSDEGYYISGVDSNFFASVKMKELIDSTLVSGWYEIPLINVDATIRQTMNKTPQGFIFTDVVEITIPHADNTKWKDLVDFFDKRYIIIAEDNNSRHWVIGYKLGASIQAYSRVDNNYVVTLSAISENKILTSIDDAYVTNNILN